MRTFQALTHVIILAMENHDLITFPVPSEYFVAVAMNAQFCKCYKANKTKKPAKKHTQENFPCLIYTSNNSIHPIKNKKTTNSTEVI